jgi:hypothetical protein
LVQGCLARRLTLLRDLLVQGCLARRLTLLPDLSAQFVPVGFVVLSTPR